MRQQSARFSEFSFTVYLYSFPFIPSNWKDDLVNRIPKRNAFYVRNCKMELTAPVHLMFHLNIHTRRSILRDLLNADSCTVLIFSRDVKRIAAVKKCG